MTVSIETGTRLLDQLRNDLVEMGVQVSAFLTGSTAFFGEGNDADIVLYTGEGDDARVWKYLSAEGFELCGGGYNAGTGRTVLRCEDANVIWVFSSAEFDQWIDAYYVCKAIVREFGPEFLTKPLRACIHMAIRGEGQPRVRTTSTGPEILARRFRVGTSQIWRIVNDKQRAS